VWPRVCVSRANLRLIRIYLPKAGGCNIIWWQRIDSIQAAAVDELARTSPSLQHTAQQGDLEAITQILEHIIAAHARVTTVRQNQTLEIYLTHVHRGSLDGCALMIYSAIYALGIDDLTKLIVLEGLPQANHEQWQQTFTLAKPGATAVAATTPSSTSHQSLLPKPQGTSVNNSLTSATNLPDLAPKPEAPAVQTPTSPPATYSHPWPFSPQRNRWLQWMAAVAFSFLLGAGMAQWRYRQGAPLVDATAPTPDLASEPIPLAPEAKTLGPSAHATEDGAAPEPSAGVAEATVNRSEAEKASPVQVIGQSLAHSPQALANPPSVTIKAVGDIIMGTNYPRTRMPADWQYFFDGIKFHLGEADLVFGNFESTLTEVPHSAKNTSRPMTFAFRSPPWYASVLRAAGFNVLNVANNHSMDFFEQGFNDTIANIESEGMLAVGRKGEIQYTEVNGIKIAFIGFSYLNAHNTVHDLDAAGALVQEAEQNADVVVISVHAGKEGTDAVFSRNQTEYFYSENRGNLVHFSRTVVDYGADLVLGHGPHVPRAVELYNNRLIAYSLGNFLGYRTLSTQGALGLSMILQVSVNGDGQFKDGRIIPAALDANGVPYLDNHFGSVILVRNATRRDFPDTPLVIDDVGNLLRRE
jgi:poly-gamma-glutamate capsule biosynthesis protein CapA/YwtB (metallophosphatase superfamily)